ncbi:hypothetical protein [Pseudemcibacter aquimaris]|uniref:hypothetical protein n=1 Tax=Pseudemcibacter aquimaris TaxID=2857064 RepID=UPI002010DED4|nr:hypothetical protein [Pseudemcibacter aquimaris]MCC3859931.1 hypothetical protein [Pseudemcibacter aquimaris]WDU57263.1 hypothetical protein KW060_08635 [Pseudemcibacter aquimaris]
MNSENELSKNKMVKCAFLAVIALLMWSVLLLWSWNSTLTELFGLQSIQFKHAFMFATNIAFLVFVLNIGRRRPNNRPH